MWPGVTPSGKFSAANLPCNVDGLILFLQTSEFQAAHGLLVERHALMAAAVLAAFRQSYGVAHAAQLVTGIDDVRAATDVGVGRG